MAHQVATFLREGHKTKQVTVLPVHTAVFFAINYLAPWSDHGPIRLSRPN